jgi:AcrR family transcriptional regulator
MTSNRHSSGNSSARRDRAAGGAIRAGDDAAGCRTRARIMAVAERMIAERGAQQFSIRDITGRAGVNLAAISYHFGSKERLVAEVLARRIAALNTERIAQLDKLEAAARGKPASAAAIMEVLINTTLPGDESERARNRRTIKMLARFALDPDEEIADMLKAHFMPLRKRIILMLARALPHLGREEVDWRATQAFGLVWHHILFAEIRCRHNGKKLDVKKERRRLLNFCVAGLRMPSDAQNKS